MVSLPTFSQPSNNESPSRVHSWWNRAYEVTPTGAASRWHSMEGMRGLAVLLVFFVHYYYLFGEYSEPNSFGFQLLCALATVGHAGVDLFFVLSGYLIYGAVIKRDIHIGRFLARRLERLYPTFLAVFTLYLGLSFVFPTENKISFESPMMALTYIAANVALLPGIFPIKPIITVAWSLSYELLFYLITPFAVVILRMRGWSPKWRIVFVGMIVFAYSAYCLIGPYPRVRMIAFGSGVFLYESIHSYGMLTRLRSYASLIAIIAFSVGLATYGSVRLNLFGEATTGRVQNVGGTMVLSVALYVFVLVGLGKTRLSQALSWTPARYLGNMSYSYYLIHGITLKGIAMGLGILLPSAMLPRGVIWLLLPPVFAVTWVSSTTLFLFIEKPFSLTRTRK